jgi:hypothetical protein
MRLAVVVSGVALLLACAAPPPPRAVPERAPGGLEPIDPGTSSMELLSARACARCHEGQHEEWGASRHAVAWTNGIFRREYRETPRRWCVHCHAPLTAQVAEVAAGGGPLADEGVGCASCHVRAGRIVARERRAGSPHDTLVRPELGSPATCAGCHQFEYPIIDDDGEVRRLSAFPMQETVAQFRRGPHAGIDDGCRGCHALSPYGHRYPGAHDPAMLERALAVELCRDGEVAVMSLENRGAGHNVPTGDVHRHLYLRLWRSSAPERLYDVFIGRRFQPVDEGGKKTVWDSTLAPRERRRWRVPVAELGDDPAEPLRLELRYVYTSDELPRPTRDPGEPTARTLLTRSARFEELPGCAR